MDLMAEVTATAAAISGDKPLTGELLRRVAALYETDPDFVVDVQLRRARLEKLSATERHERASKGRMPMRFWDDIGAIARREVAAEYLEEEAEQR